MSQDFKVPPVKEEIMIEDYVPNSQPFVPHRVEPTASAYIPERHSMSSPILEIGTIVENWARNNITVPGYRVPDPNTSNDPNKSDGKSPSSSVNDHKTFACDVCEYTTRHKQSLISHQRNHTGEKPYACSHCSYRTGKPGNLTVHIRKHTGEKPYACGYCEYRGSQRVSLINHLKTHTGEKPYACDQCDYRGSQRVSLINHKKTHTGEKPFVCDVCDYRTSFRGNLSQHKRRHTGEKPFACGQCDYKSSQRTPWLAHLKKRHGGGPFMCDLCEYSSNVAEELAEHRKTHGNPAYHDHGSLFAKSFAHPNVCGMQHCTNQGHFMAGNHPTPDEPVRAFSTTLQWAIENARSREEIEMLRRMRYRALEQYADQTIGKLPFDQKLNK